MPRLEDGELVTAHKFKKRRAWIDQDVVSPKLEAEKKEYPTTSLDYNMKKTRVEHDYNMSITRLEHECDNKKLLAQNIFYASLVRQKIELTAYENDDRCLILSLSDVQRRMFWHVAFECINRESLRTGPIEIKGFFSALGIATAVVRTSLNRLIEKRLLQREKGKLGKNGFAIISLPKPIYDIAKEIVGDFHNTQATKI